MSNKKGISHTIEAIVISILGLSFLIFGILFFEKIFESSTEWTEGIGDQIRGQALEDCKSGNSKIVLYRYNFNDPTLTPLVIKNLGEDDEFTLSMTEVSGYNIDADKIFSYRKEPVFVKLNECRLVGIKVTVPSDLPKNFYIFDLKIENSKGFYDSRELSLDLRS